MPVLDTCFLIDLLRGRPAAVSLLRDLEGRREPLKVPAIVLHELYRGVAASKFTSRERAVVEAALGGKPILPYGPEAARAGGTLEAKLHRGGRRLDPEDCMIAATALTEGDELVTRDGGLVGRVEGLRTLTYS